MTNLKFVPEAIGAALGDRQVNPSGTIVKKEMSNEATLTVFDNSTTFLSKHQPTTIVSGMKGSDA